MAIALSATSFSNQDVRFQEDDMMENANCPQCGATLSSQSLRGLCTACLLKLGGGLSPLGSSAGQAAGNATEGRRIGDYDLIEEVARGGMGVVFKAHQRSLNRTVALKMILEGPYAREEFRHRFRVEAEAAASLKHPNIVTIHEIGEHEKQPYFTMDFIEGQTLAEITQGRPLPPTMAARHAIQIAEAVHCAHASGILHRDLKPSNVLIDSMGKPRITDFGLAKRFDESANPAVGESAQSITLTGQTLGSPNFMAPEQLGGKRAQIGPPTDVHGIGAILYQMLTGRAPFSAGTLADTLNQVRNIDPPPPRLLNPAVPIDLASICLKCLEKDPRRRYANAKLVSEDLIRWTEGRPVLARPLSLPGKVWKWMGRHPAVSGLLALLVFVSTIGFLSVLWQRNRALQAAEATNRLLVRTYVDRGLDLLGNQDTVASLPYFVEAMKSEPRSQPTESDAVHRMRLGHALGSVPRLLHLLPHDLPVVSVAFSPDGLHLACAEQGGVVKVWNLENPSTALSLAMQRADPSGRFDDAGLRLVAFSPDGSTVLATTAGKRARIWDATSGQPLTPEMTHDGKIYHVAFSNDGQRVATSSDDRTVRLWNAKTGQSIAQPLHHRGPVVATAFDPTGRFLAAAVGLEESSSVVWDIETSKAALTIPLTVAATTTQFSSDGRSVLFACRDGSTRIWDVASKAQRVIVAQGVAVNTAAFSPDGRRFIAGGDSHQAHIWDANTGQSATSPILHKGAIVSACFSPDGSLALTASWDHSVRLLDVAQDELLCPPLGHAGMVNHAVFSPDGETVATACQDTMVRVWDLTRKDGRTVLSPGIAYASKGLHSFNLPMNHTAFSGDSRLLAVAGSNGDAWLWDVESSSLLRSFGQRSGSEVYTVEISPDKAYLAMASSNGDASLFEVSTGRRIHDFTHPLPLSMAHFSPNGALLVSGCFDGAARIWSNAEGKLLHVIRHSNVVMNAEFSRTGREVVTASLDGTARVWDATTGQPVTPPLQHKAEVLAAVFSPDGMLVATASYDHTVGIWNSATGARIVPPLIHPDRVTVVTFSPDGKRIATGDFRGGVRQWDPRTGLQIGVKMGYGNGVQALTYNPSGILQIGVKIGHGNGVQALAYNPNSTTVQRGNTHTSEHLSPSLLVAHFDSPGRIWDSEAGIPISGPLHDKLIYATFSPDGNWVATCGKDGKAQLWDFHKESRPADFLINLAQVMGGYRFDSLGNRIEIPLSEIKTLWNALRVRHPAEFTRDLNSRVNWHLHFEKRFKAASDSLNGQFHAAQRARLTSTNARGQNNLSNQYPINSNSTPSKP